jgi:hypothetical protein
MDNHEGVSGWIQGILAMVIATTTAAVATVAKVSSHTTQLNTMEKRLNAHAESITEMEVLSAGFARDVLYIKEGLDNMNDKLERLLARGAP